MPTLPVPFPLIQSAVVSYHAALDEGWPPMPGRGQRSAVTEAAAAEDLDPRMLGRRLDTAVALGVEVRGWPGVTADMAEQVLRRYRAYDEDFRAAESRLSRPGKARAGQPRSGLPPAGQRAARAPTAPAAPAIDMQALAAQVVPALRRGPHTLDELAERLKADVDAVTEAVARAQAAGALVVERAGRLHLDDAPALGIQQDADGLEFRTDKNGRFRFAAVGDTHLGSKYERLDCLNDFYDQCEARGITTVLHAGNWIDGEASFNMHDLTVHGMDAQMQYLARHYPVRRGITTYAITGADHEGWYARREGVDVGRYAANTMRDAGRTDWVDVGYMERFLPLVHAASGRGSPIHLMHPGGGSAYALSYAPQKIVEGYDGGDKPACLLIGHYHKSGYNLIRNVHTAQVGCFQDQTVFMRQRKLSAHVGGCFMELVVDPRTGAFVECSYTFRNYFVRGYYMDRWSEHGPVKSAARSAQL